MKKIVLASNNNGKLAEFKTLLSSFNFNVLSQKDFNIESVEETGLSFIENAILKARHASKKSGLPAIADDSGIEVDALNGAPGIYSARYSGEHSNDQKNLETLLNNLKGIEKKERSARYQCVLVYLKHPNDPTPIIAQGTWEGQILEKPRGSGGFGYDPVFFVDHLNCSSAELTPDIKNKISHRAIAMNKLKALLKEQNIL